MNCKSEIKKQIEVLQEEICKALDKDGMKITCEIVKLSKDLDKILNIWNQICIKKP